MNTPETDNVTIEDIDLLWKSTQWIRYWIIFIIAINLALVDVRRVHATTTYAMQKPTSNLSITLSFLPSHPPYTKTPFITDIEVSQTARRAHHQAPQACEMLYAQQKFELIKQDAKKWHAWWKSDIHQAAKYVRWFKSECLVSITTQINGALRDTPIK